MYQVLSLEEPGYEAISGAYFLVKGRYCTRAIAIKFVEAANKIGMGGDENQVQVLLYDLMHCCL